MSAFVALLEVRKKVRDAKYGSTEVLLEADTF
jgi:hypothetical protein